MIKLIVGLANPGTRYYNTRHNVGAWYINLLSMSSGVSLKKETKFIGYTSYIHFADIGVHLLIPDVFMNISGTSVISMATFYSVNPSEILVAHDELDIPPGIAKFKFGGTHNGHNGLKDIIDKFDNNSNFYRLRIGIGHPGDKNKVINFVLSEPLVFERELIDRAIDKAVYCTKIWFQSGLIKATNNLHAFKA